MTMMIVIMNISSIIEIVFKFYCLQKKLSGKKRKLLCIYLEETKEETEESVRGKKEVICYVYV